MNPKAAICLIIALFTFLAGYGTMKMHERSQQAADQAFAAKEDAESTENTRKAMETRLSALRNSSADLRAHYKTWEAHFQKSQSSKEAELMVKEVMDNGPVLLSGKFTPIQQKDNKYLPTVVRGNLTFEDKYSKVMNWFGELETKLPTCRISECTLTRGQSEDAVRMNLVIDVPIVAGTKGTKATKG
jgi:hypothetical protein